MNITVWQSKTAWYSHGCPPTSLLLSSSISLDFLCKISCRKNKLCGHCSVFSVYSKIYEFRLADRDITAFLALAGRDAPLMHTTAGISPPKKSLYRKQKHVTACVVWCCSVVVRQYRYYAWMTHALRMDIGQLVMNNMDQLSCKSK